MTVSCSIVVNMLRLGAVFVLFSLAGARTTNTCDPNRLIVYRVYLNTMWNRDVFPKQYPEWRPPAQWSKLVGRSHNSTYELFEIGKTVSPGLKLFAEQGDTNLLDQETQGEGGVFDEFNAPPITEGEGQADAEFFIDGNHSMVSMVARVVPSPDWFIGVDSFNLCVEGLWLESVIIEVDPLDAGSDNGFTFTSPNWPTIPQAPISRITSQKPNHPANSFYYPDRPQHPPIATFQFVKVREYELAREFDPSPSAPRQAYHQSGLRDDAANAPSRSLSSSMKYDKKIALETNEVVSNNVLPPSRTVAMTSRTPKHALLTSLINKINKRRGRKNRRGRKMAARRRRDCVVSQWSQWTPCSKSCGIGEQKRTRDIKKHARRRGRPCPILQETQWCGSQRDCIEHKYFEW